MRVTLLTNCTNRKALEPAPSCIAANLSARPLSSFLSAWRARLDRAEERVEARRLYLGRGFMEARLAWESAAKLTDADLYIASAGLGFVTATQRVPSYSITVSSRGEDSVMAKVGLSDPAEWWDALTTGRRGLLARCASADLVVAALSGPYLHMLRHELSDFVAHWPHRLRLICRADPGAIDPALRAVWMPYDNRLNGPKSPSAGTEGDFAQRALRHFVERILIDAPLGDARNHARRVRASLAPLSPPRRRERRRLTDEQLKALMRRIGPEVGAGRMLRVLRDEKNVACEQSRCSALFKQTFTKQSKDRAAR